MQAVQWRIGEATRRVGLLTVTRSFRPLALALTILGALLIGTLTPLNGAITPALAAGTIYYVDQAHGDSGNSCTSSSSACQTIQSALNKTVDGDSVEIAPGTYPETLTITTSIALTGGVALSPDESGATIVDAHNQGSLVTISAHRGVTLAGLTIQHGSTTGDGGGVAASSEVTLTNDLIMNNSKSRWRHLHGLHDDAVQHLHHEQYGKRWWRDVPAKYLSLYQRR